MSVICPLCKRVCDDNTEQAVSVELYKACVICKFKKGDGSDAELNRVIDLNKKRSARELSLNVVIPKPNKEHSMDCNTCGKEMHFMVGWFDEEHDHPKLAHNLFHCDCGVICIERIGSSNVNMWIAPNSVEPTVVPTRPMFANGTEDGVIK